MWCSVKELDVEFVYENFHMLPTHLFASHSLVTLKLSNDFNMKVPTNVCLPTPKTLHLKHIAFSDDDSIHKLISGCLVLEELVTEHLMLLYISELTISSLSLKRLVLEFGEVVADFLPKFNYVSVIGAPILSISNTLA